MTRIGNILIVEDDSLISLVLKHQLEKFGYQVRHSVTRGEDAIAWLESGEEVDIILMDVNLAGVLDGIETAERINQKHPIPLVFITSFKDDGTLDKAKNTMAYGFVKKPIDSETLKHTIEMALSQHQHRMHTKSKPEPIAASPQLFQSTKKIPIWDKDGLILLSPADIYYLQVNSGMISFRSKDSQHSQRGTLSDWAEKLAPYSFYRCHKNFLVSLNKIHRISLDVDNSYLLHMKNIPDIIPVAQKKSGHLIKLLQL